MASTDVLCFSESEISTRPVNATATRDLPSTKSGRKGHTKSRGGCYNCKRRKVKCPENRPVCHYCKKIQLKCIYPRLSSQEVVANHQPLPLVQSSLQATPTRFSLVDMKLFHHFLTNWYPHLPLGNDKVWVTDIASFSHSVCITS